MNTPLLILAATPKEQVKIRNFFDTSQKSAWNLLAHPGQLRYAGWDLQTLDTPRIKKGEYLEVVNGDRKILNLYEDGTFVFNSFADGSFLGWGQNDEGFQNNPRLNPVAIIEVIFNFVDFYNKLADFFEEKPENMIIKAQIQGAFLDEKHKLYLTPYGINTFAWITGHERGYASENDMIKEFTFPLSRIKENPAEAAYSIIEKIYLWFGLTPDKIPYVKEVGGKKSIDTDKIRAIN